MGGIMALLRRFMIAILIVTTTQGVVLASGLTIYEFGAEEQAQGNAVAAQIDSPSAIFYNPAGVANLSGTQIKIGGSALFPSINFHSDVTATDTDVKSGPVVPSYVFVTKNIDRFGFGLGVFSANGNKVEYPKDWEGRFFLTSSELLQVNIAPTISYRFSENIAAGVNLVGTYSKIKQNNQIFLLPLGIPQEGSAQLEGDGFGVGFTAGVQAKIGASSFAAVYKSPIKIKYSGDATFETPPPASPFFPNGGFTTNQKFPQMIVLAASNQPLRPLTLEADLQWTNWHVYDSQTFAFDKQTVAVQDFTVPFHWKNTWTIRLGGHYDINDNIGVRLGYVFDPSAVPGNTISPLFPELNKHIVTAGIGYHKNGWKADLYYAHIISESRHVDNSLPGFPVHKGTYEASADAVGAAVSYMF